jgi:DNA processing protein
MNTTALKKDEAAYWITLAGLPRWGSEKVNRLIVKIFAARNSDIISFFNLNDKDWIEEYELTDKEIFDLNEAKKQLPNNSFVAENLLSQGYEIIPLISPEYSQILKANLKTKGSPPVIYIKGNKQIIHEKSIAIVGSRDASEISLKFTDLIAEKASKEFQVIVSGFAKGVDRQALESSLKYKGQSIIVLPQGILTFSSGIRQYYEQIVEGNLLVLSTFHPNLPWNTGLAMARNNIIYGLASDIYVAQSGDSGGTWEGVMSGLKAGRTIYVRYPGEEEKNANRLLIEKGAVPVDFSGNVIEEKISESAPVEEEEIQDSVGLSEDKNINRIASILENNELSPKEIAEKLGGDITPRKVSLLMNKSEKFEKCGSSPVKYKLKSDNNLKLDL